ncbi:galactose mutarotase [Verrucomicrobiaceae bacterium N1E253]|uniref:Aldose 1-epimerase n=1 Tax=Oceaniferula marina TaxID=2748318 RepID=A0A851GID5_9BACT|nr:aldose epimerase family protein [Oceaniferula marina]NWK53994.1 galactose mutarotase [Oceaniferula marina]
MNERSLPTAQIHGILNGKQVQCYTLSNSQGMTATVSELGAHLTSVTIPGPDRKDIELTLGHANFEGWCNNGPSLGSTCGRFGNRIAHGEFSLNGKQYTLATNNEPGGIPCHLHGGNEGFNRKIWKATPLGESKRQGVAFTLSSPDGDEGYPGKLDVTVTYWLSDDNELIWQAKATTDMATPVNLVNHTYWNLSGDFNQAITDHEIQIHADHYLPTNPGMIPTGEIRSVKNTPMDFTQPKPIGKDIDTSYESLNLGAGYDHCWVLNQCDGKLHTAAIVQHPASGRRLEVLTDQPGVQFYTGNFLDGSVQGRNGNTFPKRTGLCLETEGFPDAPNHPNFPSSILHPGETYQHTMVVKFQA